MRFRAADAYRLLPLLSLVAAGLASVEISNLRATAIPARKRIKRRKHK